MSVHITIYDNGDGPKQVPPPPQRPAPPTMRPSPPAMPPQPDAGGDCRKCREFIKAARALLAKYEVDKTKRTDHEVLDRVLVMLMNAHKSYAPPKDGNPPEAEASDA